MIIVHMFVWSTSVSQLSVDESVLFPATLREVAPFPSGLCHYPASMQQGNVVANIGCYMYGSFLRHHCALSNRRTHLASRENRSLHRLLISGSCSFENLQNHRNNANPSGN